MGEAAAWSADAWIRHCKQLVQQQIDEIKKNHIFAILFTFMTSSLMSKKYYY